FPVPDVNEYFAGNKNVKTVYQLGGQCVLCETNETKKLKLKRINISRVDPISRLNTRRPGSIVNHIREWPFEEVRWVLSKSNSLPFCDSENGATSVEVLVTISTDCNQVYSEYRLLTVIM
ncbi:hypothetical protein V1477_010150, partial [Vespula maculifrons]